MEACVIGTRGSPLAMWQADYVRRALIQAHAGLEVRIEIIRTTGDVLLEPPLARIGGTGVFTKEIENALLKRQRGPGGSQPQRPADSARGRTSPGRRPQARGPGRRARRARRARRLAQLPAGAKVLTGSLRRQAQLMHRRPDLKIAQMRGNVQTRLKKFDRSDARAIVLACARDWPGWAWPAGSRSGSIPPSFCRPAARARWRSRSARTTRASAKLCGALDDPPRAWPRRRSARSWPRSAAAAWRRSALTAGRRRTRKSWF